MILEKNNALEALKSKPSEMDEEEFKKKDLEARDILIKCIDDRVLDCVRGKTTARAMFEALEQTYVRTGISAQVAIRQHLGSMRFQRGSLQQFIEEFDQKLEELSASGASVTEPEKVSMLLAAMPGSFRVVVTSLNIAFNKDRDTITYQ